MGINPKHWGPSCWIIIHAGAVIADRCPDRAHGRSLYIRMLRSIVATLPCVYCRESAPVFLRQILRRRSLTCCQIASELHNLVNNKLGKRQISSPCHNRPLSKIHRAILHYFSFVLAAGECGDAEQSARNILDLAALAHHGAAESVSCDWESLQELEQKWFPDGPHLFESAYRRQVFYESFT